MLLILINFMTIFIQLISTLLFQPLLNLILKPSISLSYLYKNNKKAQENFKNVKNSRSIFYICCSKSQYLDLNIYY